jgi:hypothetical protein
MVSLQSVKIGKASDESLCEAGDEQNKVNGEYK